MSSKERYDALDDETKESLRILDLILKAGADDERRRCVKVLEDLRGSRLWTSLAHDALNEAIAALKTNASSSSGQG